MVNTKSLDPYKQIIVALLSDVQTLHSEVLSPRACRLTIQKVVKRLDREGIGFLTKTLPRLGKAFDRALTGECVFDAVSLGFRAKIGSKLPKLFGELFERIFAHDGWILPIPCVTCIKTIRTVLYLFYKLELPFTTDQEQAVLDKFIETDRELSDWNNRFEKVFEAIDANPKGYDLVKPDRASKVIRVARQLLSQLFCNFDPLDIHPRHGPGVVSTKERLHEKYRWTSISPRIEQTYPLDAYFYASLGHVCDAMEEIQSLPRKESPAQVILVPKDSRGPRLISCEPLVFQYVQQGLGRALVSHVESHPLTRYNVHFTDQGPNQRGALLGSSTGRYSTLDLNEASDRVSIGLVRLLFPEPLLSALMNCRSQSTTLPSGQELTLNKFAPMGSALCFPVLALTVWAILTAGMPDADTRESILVYGDDVVVPTAQAANAIELLESFGLKINRDKSCISGFFRESCGTDAFKGVTVTPVRIRTVWSSSRCPEVYTSYIAYANSLYHLGFYNAYNFIVSELVRIYGPIPDVSMNLSCPSIAEPAVTERKIRRRVNVALQKLQYLVYDVIPHKVRKEIDGWSMLLRYFVEGCPQLSPAFVNDIRKDVPCRCGLGLDHNMIIINPAFTVSLYTKRRSSYLALRWR